MARSTQITTFSVKQIAQAMAVCNFSKVITAAKLGVNYQSLIRAIKKNPELQELIDLKKDRLLDKAVNNIDEALDNKEPWAATLMIKTLGSQHGYAEGGQFQPTVQTNVQINLGAEEKKQFLDNIEDACN